MAAQPDREVVNEIELTLRAFAVPAEDLRRRRGVEYEQGEERICRHSRWEDRSG
jgi:hypothetical protein